MDFDATDIYGVQSEGTVKKMGSFAKRVLVFLGKRWMKHNVH